MALDPQAEREVHEHAREIFDQFNGNPRRIAIAAAQFARFAKGSTGGEMEIKGGISSRSGEPFVHLSFGDFSFQQSADEARGLALTIIEAAESAVQDAAVMRWAMETMGFDLSRAGQIVAHVRLFRSDQWASVEDQDSSPETPSQDAE